MKTNMGCRTSLDCSGGDLGNNELAQAFYTSSAAEGFIHLVGLEGGEDEEGEHWLNLPQIAFMNSQKP